MDGPHVDDRLLCSHQFREKRQFSDRRSIHVHSQLAIQRRPENLQQMLFQMHIGMVDH